MTTTTVFTKTAGQLIKEALRDSRIIPAEQPVQAVDNQRGLDSLNNVVKHWQSLDLNLWLKREAVLPLNVGQKKYLLGPTGADCATDDSFYDTQLSAAATASDLIISVDSTAGMAGPSNLFNSDPTDGTTGWAAINSATLAGGLTITNVGSTQGGADYSIDVTPGETYRVVFDYTLGTSSSCVFSVLNGSTVASTTTLSATSADNELVITAVNDTITFRAQNGSSVAGQTSTVSNLEIYVEDAGSRVGIQLDDGTRFWSNVWTVDSSTQFTLVSAITGAAAIDNTVYSYTEKIDRPMKILNLRYAPSVTDSEIPCNKWARDEYFEQPDKSTQGTVVNYYYSRQLTNGELYVWQTANNVNSVVRFTFMEPTVVYSEVEDLIQFPSEWFMALKWAIASDLGPSYGLPDNRQLKIDAQAAKTLEEVLGYDNEYSSMYFQPEFE